MNSGSLLSSHELKLQTKQQLQNTESGRIQGGRLDITAPTLDNQGKITQTGSQALALDADRLKNAGYIGFSEAEKSNTANNGNNGGMNTGNGSSADGSGGAATGNPNAHPSTANGAGKVENGSTDNTAPTAPVQLSDGLIKTTELNNTGRIEANGGMDLTAQNGLTNTAELNLNKLNVGGRQLDNRKAKLTAKQVTADVSRFDNREGTFTAARSLNVQTDTADNRKGTLQSAGTFTLYGKQSVDNSEGKIAVAEAADIQTSSLNNQGGSIDAAETAVAAQTVDNRQGFIRSDKGSVLQVADSLNNQAGLIGSAGSLNIHDAAQSSLKIDNTGGNIVAAKDVSLQAKSLDNDGTLAAARDVSVSLYDDFGSKRDIEAGRKLSFSTKGRLKNAHTIQAGDAVSLTADRIENTAAGRIQSENRTELNGKNGITNRGLINSNGLTLLHTEARLDNIGTGRIYGDRVAVAADTLTNREETVNGKTQAAVIAARERLDIGAGEVENREAASLFSSGSLHIGSALNESQQAQGINGSLHNRSASIEALGNIRIATKDLQNTNEHLRFHTEETRREHRIEYQAEGTTERYPEGSQSKSGWELYEDESTHMRTPDGRSHSVWYKYDYDRITTESKITESKPGKIISGGNLVLDAAKLKNHDSQIIAGGKLSVSTPESSLSNHETPGTKTVTDQGNLHRYYRHQKKGRDSTGHNQYAYTPPAEVRSIRMGTSAYKEYANPSLKAPDAPKADQVSTVVSAAAENSIRTEHNSTFALPDSSLFAVAPNSKGYLIESDPAFTDYRKWLGSDYMLAALQNDPNHIHKRLGDGYYEQKLVNEQIAKLTGYRRLDGYANDEAQFKALMDNGITAAKELQLTPGIALSAEQVARLTADIVWLENETVTLPDGTTQTVLKPKVYVRARPQDVNGQGALLSGGVVDIDSNTIENRGGLIAGREALVLNAQNIKNLQGGLQGKHIFATADNDVVNSGSISAENTLLLKAGRNIESRSETRSNQNEQGSVNHIDRAAGIYLTGKQDGIVLLDAGNNIVLTASELTNQSVNGQTVLNAGRTIRLDTADVSRNQHNIFDADNYAVRKEQRETGSTIRTQGNLSLNAEENIHIRAADVGSGQGRLKLAAGQDIQVEAGKAYTETEDALKYTGRSGGGTKQKITRHLKNQNEQAVSGTLDGKEVVLVSERDITVTGSNIIADNNTVLLAKNNIDIQAAEERRRSAEINKKEKSGLMSSGGIGFMAGSKKETQTSQSDTVSHTESVVGSLKGNTLIAAGKNYTQTGSAVSSPEGDVVIAAEKIDIRAAQNRYSQDQKQVYEQKGVTVAVSVPIVNTVTGAVNAVKTAKTVGKSKNNRVNAMAAANALKQGADSGRALAGAAKDPKGAVSQAVKVSITYGHQKNTSESHIQGTQAQESKITGGGKVFLTAAGAGKESDIRISGSDVYGGQGTQLKADNAVYIEAARQEHQECSENKSAGFNAGVAMSIGKSISFGITAGANYGKGYGNGDETTYRNSRIGSKDSRTVIESGGGTVIKGGQVKGKSVAVTAENLHIESLQDTAVFKSKQENVSAQVTAGYGFSAEGSYNRSQSNSDYASVNEQSGIFAGDDGYQINVGAHTGLKGGLITSAQTAADNGSNRFGTDTLTSADIRNHSRYEGKSFGLDGSAKAGGRTLGQGADNNPAQSRLTTVADKNGMGSTIGYGSDSGNQNSMTRSGINTRNITIADEAAQTALTGQTAEQTKAQIYTGTATDTAEQHTGRLKNVFDRERVENELNLQRTVSQEFGKNAAQGIARLSDYLGNTQDFQRAEILKSAIETELTQTQDGAQRENLQQALNQIENYLEANRSSYEIWKEGGIGRSILHAGAGGLVTGNIGGALGAGGTSLAAPYLEKATENLSPLGKAAVNTVGGAAVGYVLGGNAGAVTGANADWNNRQLHPSERQLIKKHAEAMQAHVKRVEGKDISLAEAELRLEKQILRWVDKASDDGHTDQTAISVLGISGKSGDTRWDYRDYANRYPSVYADTNLFAEYLPVGRKTQLQNLHSGRPNAQIQAGERKNEELAMELVGNVPIGRVAKPAVKSWLDWLKGRKPGSGNYAADTVLVGADGLPAPTTIGNKGNLPDNVSASIRHKSGQSTGSSIPVPEPVKITLKDGTILTYQSNPKHTLGYGGSRPGHTASIEPPNSSDLFKNSIPSKTGTRIAYDKNTNTVHQFFSDADGKVYHWSGTLDRSRIDKLNIGIRRKLGIPGK
ncbi:hemagglutinin repeat-containing protein [Neisseria leonii]|uniref:Hemagglutinin repeat-containing protein n=2 Tax=Neisseria leonii TaxID=2995413 RepID=A0AAQ3XLC1_9NEIS